MIRVEDTGVLTQSAHDEHDRPYPQSHKGDRIIYLPRNNYGRPTKAIGIIQITDFDLSRRGNIAQNRCIQVDVYRAPEVILGAGYSYAADIWNLGVLVR